MFEDSAVALAKELIAESDGKSITVYVMSIEDRPPTPQELNRANCDPVGVSEERWPMRNNKKMHHLISIDLNTVPDLKKEFRSEVRAISTFVSDPMEFAWGSAGYSTNYREEFEVLQFTDDEVSLGVVSHNPPYEYREPRVFSCHEIELPISFFDQDEIGELLHLREEGQLNDSDASSKIDLPSPRILELVDVIDGRNCAGAFPHWIHDIDENLKRRRMVLQCDDELVEINTGDGGYLLVFDDMAYVEIG